MSASMMMIASMIKSVLLPWSMPKLAPVLVMYFPVVIA